MLNRIGNELPIDLEMAHVDHVLDLPMSDYPGLRNPQGPQFTYAR